MSFIPSNARDPESKSARVGSLLSRAGRVGALVVPVLLLLGSVDANAAGKCRPDLDQFEALRTGMDRHAVVRVLGCFGRKVSGMKIGQNDRATYSWRGKGLYGANLNVTFNNNKLVSKSQLGLR